jgi:hypothetical protein
MLRNAKVRSAISGFGPDTFQTLERTESVLFCLVCEAYSMLNQRKKSFSTPQFDPRKRGRLAFVHKANCLALSLAAAPISVSGRLKIC